MDSTDERPELQFDALTSEQSPIAGSRDPITCVVCRTGLDTEYFDANGKSVCRSCSEAVAGHAGTPRGAGVFLRAALLGGIAAILGAVLYFAVLAVSGFEVGLVAIAIGYMVGYGVRMGTHGRGGRRFQLLALALTYWALGLAYSSLAVKTMITEPRTGAASTVAASPAAGPVAPSSQPAARAPEYEPRRPMTGGQFVFGLLQLLAFTVVLPVIVVVGSLPGGLISAAIIVFGMLQAWKMTAAPVITISGPYRIGPAPASSAG